MKRLIWVSLALILAFVARGQTIETIKTTGDCLQFIRNNIPDQRDFYFDSIFTERERRKLKPAFRSWQVFDFNNDKKPDLWFIGKYKDDFFHWTSVNLYLSSPDGYRLVWLIRDKGTAFRPLVFVGKTSKGPLLIIHQYETDTLDLIDDLVAKGELNAEVCRGNDSLIYAYNAVLDFSSRPSNIKYDSIIFLHGYGWANRTDSLVINQYDNFRDYKYSSLEYKRFGTLTGQEYYKLSNLVKQIDLTQTRKKFYSWGTDRDWVRLKIYSGKRVLTFYDYGLQSSFTLKAIYDLLFALQRRVDVLPPL